LPQRAAASNTNSALALGSFLRRLGMTSCYAFSNNLGIAAKIDGAYIFPNAGFFSETERNGRTSENRCFDPIGSEALW
ncbi:hypothetical protein SB861_69340, partial [Paraburkholderia sp. SIMBA_049]